MADDYRLGFNNDGIIKLTYRIIIGFVAYNFGQYLWTKFPEFSKWVLSLDGINTKVIKEVHLTSAHFIVTFLGALILYRVLLGIVKKYIITRKIRKPRGKGISHQDYGVKVDTDYEYQKY